MPQGLTEDFYEYDSVETALHVIKAYITLNQTISVKCDRMFGVLGFSVNIEKASPQAILADCKYYRDLYVK
jgi:methyl coenzyme M reductase alpha subunit